GNRLLQLVREDDRRLLHRDNDVPWLEPRAGGGLTRVDRGHVRVHVGQHSDVADLEAALARRGHGRDLERDVDAVANQNDWHFTVGTRPYRDGELLPVIDAVTGDRHDPVAR